MKTIILCTAIFFVWANPSLAVAGDAPVEVTKIIELNDQTKSFIFNNARTWISEEFVSGKNVIDYESAESGVITGTGIATTDTVFFIEQQVKFNIKINVKDNKARIRLKSTAFLNKDSSSTYSVDSVTSTRLGEIKGKLKAITRSFARYLKSNNPADDNW